MSDSGNVRLFLAVIKSSYLIVLLTLAITVGTAALLTKIEPNRYVAGTSLVINLQSANPFETAVMPAQLASTYMATQIDIIRSPTVARKVVDLLSLTEDADARAELVPTLTPTEDARGRLAAALMNNLIVEPSRSSSVVTVSYRSTNPSRAAKIADAFAQAYIATSLELTVEPARRNAAWLEEQLGVLRARLDEAQSRLTAFQREAGIVATDERLDVETNRFNELTRNLVAAQAARVDVQSRQVGVNHPEYQRALERERTAEQALEDHKQHVLELRNQRDQVAALQQEVDNQRRNYEATIQTYYQSSLMSQFNHSNIAVLSPAGTPTRPSSPNVALNMASAVFLGLLFGVLLALLKEGMSRRVRTDEDAEALVGSKVLANV